MLLQFVNYFPAARVGNPESNVRATQTIALQQRIEGAFDQGARQVANPIRQNDAQFAVLVFEPDFVYVFGGDAGFGVENPWVGAGPLDPARNQECRRTIGADCIAYQG